MKEKTAMGVSQGPEFVGGIDVGGTKVSAALFNPDGEISARIKAPLDSNGPDRAAAQVARLLGNLEEEARRRGSKLAAAAVCVPGIVYQESGLIWAPNVPGWEFFPLKDKISAGSQFPIVIESDRAAYVSGEAWCGAARGARDAVFLAVGTGIGAGILSGGRLVRGAEDISGAVGWFALNPGFRPEYAERGCFETEASGTGMALRARRMIEAGAAAAMLERAGGRLSDVTAETVAAAARAGDAAASKVVAETASYLAMGIANIVSILNPGIVILGGGLFQAADLLLEPVRNEFKKWAQPLAARNVRVEISSLGEDAGLFGCGKMAWDAVKGA